MYSCLTYSLQATQDLRAYLNIFAADVSASALPAVSAQPAATLFAFAFTCFFLELVVVPMLF